MEMRLKFDNSWFSWIGTEVLHGAKFTGRAKEMPEGGRECERGNEQDFLKFGQWEFMCMALCCKCQTLWLAVRVCVWVCIGLCAAYQSLHSALFGALNFSWRPRTEEEADEETGGCDLCAFFPIRSQWSRKLKTFSLQSIKNNGRWQRNHSPSAKRRRMQSPVSSCSLPLPSAWVRQWRTLN